MAANKVPTEMTAEMTTTRLTLFDLDNTLLDGDSDVLWC